MTNIELALEKLEAARLILGAIDSYLETCSRLQLEVHKLADEAEQLTKGDADGTDQGQRQGQLQASLASDAANALSGDMPHDPPEHESQATPGGHAEPSA